MQATDDLQALEPVCLSTEAKRERCAGFKRNRLNPALDTLVSLMNSMLVFKASIFFSFSQGM